MTRATAMMRCFGKKSDHLDRREAGRNTGLTNTMNATTWWQINIWAAAMASGKRKWVITIVR